jgi:vitamin B12 transporter
MMKMQFLAGLALAALLAGQAPAQQADSLPAFDLEGLTVTITRSPVLRSALPQRVDVVTRADVERTPALDAADLLKRNAAVDVIQYPGLLAGVSLRGFRPEFTGVNRRTAVLIDGRPAGTANLALLDPASIERIEVLRGPASALYGSGAMAGAINVVTRRSSGALRGDLEAGYGSFATSELRGRVGGAVRERLEIDLGISRFARAGDYRIGSGGVLRGWIGDDHATKLHGDGREERVRDIGDGVVRENSRYQTLSGNARLGVRLHPLLRLEARGELFRADEAEIPGDLHHGTTTDLIKDVGRRTGELSLAAQLPGSSALLRVYGGEEDGAYHATWAAEPFVSFVERALHAGAQLQNVARLGAHTLTGGVDVAGASTRSEVFSAAGVRSAPFSPDWDVRSQAAFGEARIRLAGERLVVTAGGRLDRITLALRETPYRGDVAPAEESFASFNPSAGARFEVGGGAWLHGTVGRAFVAPNAFQRAGMAFPGRGSGQTSVTLGNPDLRAESSVTWDAGVGAGGAGGALQAEVTYFQTRLRDRISTAFAAFGDGGRPVTPEGDEVTSIVTYTNAAEAEMRGIEWQFAYVLPRLALPATPRLFASGTHMRRAHQLSPAVWLDSGALAGRSLDRAAVFRAIRLGEATEGEIRNVAARTVVFGAELQGDRGWFTRLGGRFVGERLDTDFSDWTNISEIRYPAAMTLDLSLGARLAGRFRVGLEVENLTDENVYEVRGYSLPGRQIRLQVGAGL